AALPRLRDLLGEIAGEARGGADHHRAVEAVGSGADHAPQARRAELEPALEAIAQRRLVARVEEPPGLRARLRIGILGQPPVCHLAKALIHSSLPRARPWRRDAADVATAARSVDGRRAVGVGWATGRRGNSGGAPRARRVITSRRRRSTRAGTDGR